MRRSLIALALTTTLAACGSGGNTGDTKLSFDSVTAFGASLTDSGTFGYKFTVQPSEGQTYEVWTERIAGAYGIEDLCPAYLATSATTFADNTAEGCSNYAIGGSVVHNFIASANPANDTVNNASPISILKQLTDAATNAATRGGFTDKDLILVGGDAGANDVAAMLTYMLYAQQGDPAYQAHFVQRVMSVIPAGEAYDELRTQAQTLLASAETWPQAGGLYMTLIAKTLASTIKATVLQAGATHVVVQNTLDVTKTPKFQLGIKQQLIAAGKTEEEANAALAQIGQLATGWLTAFNNQLATELEGDKRIAMVDFYTHFNREMENPEQYALTNVTTPVCTAVQTAMGAADPDELRTCTDAILDAGIPEWRSYVFANTFHPTPYGHLLLSEMVAEALAKAGWL